MNRLFVRLYLDEDVDVLVAELLRSYGFTAVTTREVNRLESEDEENESDVRLVAAEGEAFLDFGHEPRDASVQIDTLPQELVRLAAELDIQIVFSLYLFETYDDEAESAPGPPAR